MSNNNPSRRELITRVVAAIRTSADATDRLDQLAAKRFGLNRTDTRSLEILRRLGPMTANKLAVQVGVTTGGVTTVIDRLERAGYARRRSDEQDRRLVLVEATKLAAQREHEIFGDLIDGSAKVVSSFSDAELVVIERYLSQIGELVSSHTERLAAATRGKTSRRSTAGGRQQTS
jgi:DNA-binding MarR family transcriptional regulator